MIEPLKPDMPRRARARAMGEILKYAEGQKDDEKLGAVVREIVRRVRQEEAAWSASLNEHGLPLKIL